MNCTGARRDSDVSPLVSPNLLHALALSRHQSRAPKSAFRANGANRLGYASTLARERSQYDIERKKQAEYRSYAEAMFSLVFSCCPVLTVWGTGGREFKSLRSDQKNTIKPTT